MTVHIGPRRAAGQRRRGRANVCTGAVIAVAVLWAWGAAAWAHVTLSPTALPQGTGDAILTFRVPNESITAPVTGLRIEFPAQHPIAVVSPQAGSGWTVAVKTARLAKPITTDDGTFTSTVSEIDWSGGSIPVGQFGEFNVLAQGLPTGTRQLVFKAIQLYGDGTTVAWIQIPDRAAPDPAHPAPVLTLTPARGGASTSTATSATPSAAGAPAPSGSPNDHGLVVLAVVVAAFAAVVALLALWLGRPRLLGEPSPTAGPPDAVEAPPE